MAVLVVYPLEVVYVEDDNGEGLAIPPDLLISLAIISLKKFRL